MALERITPDDAAENWRKVRAMARIYRLVVLLPLLAIALAIIWGAGYAQGLLSACSPAARPETISKESHNVR